MVTKICLIYSFVDAEGNHQANGTKNMSHDTRENIEGKKNESG